jgi:hypothetical protein
MEDLHNLQLRASEIKNEVTNAYFSVWDKFKDQAWHQVALIEPVASPFLQQA